MPLRHRRGRSDGLFTPPSLKGTIIYPSNAGGPTGAGCQFRSRARHRYVNTNKFHASGEVGSRQWTCKAARRADPHAEFGRNVGGTFRGEPQDLLSHSACPQSAALGELHAIGHA